MVSCGWVFMDVSSGILVMFVIFVVCNFFGEGFCIIRFRLGLIVVSIGVIVVVVVYVCILYGLIRMMRLVVFSVVWVVLVR